jgi:alkylated DNA repair dioxygenase AlkB
MEFSKTFSLTFGDVAENHKGMQKIGNFAEKGFTVNDLNRAKCWFYEKGCKCKLVNLTWLLPEEAQTKENGAYVLLVKGGVNALLDDENGADALFLEQDVLEKDTKAFMYGRVVNKHARHNLCFGETHQAPNYEKGEGTIYAFDEVPLLSQIRAKLGEVMGECGTNLQAEGNYYYDLEKCGIGYHGDTERKKVIALRLGATIPLSYRWYIRNKQDGTQMDITDLDHGDLYIMSEKATGFDWKSSSKYTLRHSAGSDKFIHSK